MVRKGQVSKGKFLLSVVDWENFVRGSPANWGAALLF